MDTETQNQNETLESPVLIVESRVRQTLDKTGYRDMRLSTAALTRMSARVAELVSAGATRAHANGRKTIQPQDL